VARLLESDGAKSAEISRDNSTTSSSSSSGGSDAVAWGELDVDDLREICNAR
jgi:hypothetical protein